jgi:hypothetical protein
MFRLRQQHIGVDQATVSDEPIAYVCGRLVRLLGGSLNVITRITVFRGKNDKFLGIGYFCKFRGSLREHQFSMQRTCIEQPNVLNN